MATLHEVHAAVGTEVTVEAQQTAAGWSYARLRYAPAGMKKGEHTVTLTFTPGGAGPSKFDVVVGRKTHLASGELVTSADGSEAWTLTQPAWAHRAPVVASETQSRSSTQTTTSQNVTPGAETH